MENVIVTGGAGFVGSHLCEALVKLKKYKVFSIDDYSTGSEQNHIEGVKYISDSTQNIQRYAYLCPTYLYHLGEYSRVERSLIEPEVVLKKNLVGTAAICEFWRHSDCKLIYSGSSTKFGDNGESKNQTPYGWSKATNTELINNYARWYSLNHVIVYFYNVYGPREMSSGDYATLIGIYREKMRQGQNLPVVRPGTQTRNFTHVKDIVDGILLAAENSSGDDFGIGSPIQYTINQVAELFGGDVEYLPERKGNRMKAELIDKNIRALGWTPKHTLESYVQDIRLKNWNS